MIIKGIAASEGIAISKVFKLEENILVIPEHEVKDKDKEWALFEECLLKATNELEAIKVKTQEELDQEHAMIFDAHIQMVNDPEIKSQVYSSVYTSNINVIKSYDMVCNTFISVFEQMPDDYFKERAADVKDVKKRVLSHLLGVELSDPSSISSEVIIVAEDLTPSDTAQLNKNLVKGFVTNIGGRTSHSAIMARTLEIPAVVGTKDILSKVNNDDSIIINGIEGYAIINPTDNEVNEHIKLKEEYETLKSEWAKYKNKESVTNDNHHIEIAANIGSPDDVQGVLDNTADGIGLYRTEFLYMNSEELPSEDFQFEAYKKVLEQLPNSKVVIRTLDIGGDKHLPYLELDEELNPFLGHRALRLCLSEKEMFKTQLRALLRASVYGDLHIMFPMVATIDEIKDAKALLKECEQELKDKNITVSDYKVGIMVEIPSVAILADQFSKYVDFFSIGTNDLIQYSFAAGRMNPKVSYLYQPLNPSLLRLIKSVIDASHQAGIWTGMCGEMASDQLAIPILLGLGLDEFSMSATSVLKSRKLISELSFEEMQKLAQKAINLETEKEVKELVKNTLNL